MAIGWSRLLFVACLLPACGGTVDSLGTDAPAAGGSGGSSGSGGARTLAPLTPPASYPNPLRDVLGRGEAEIEARIAGLFEHLFRGSPDTQAIYYPSGDDQAYVRDIFHNDIRTEGIGFGMLFAVERNEREIVDRLFRYAKANLRQSGASDGYYVSSCDVSDGGTTPCLDPFGMQLMAMSLVLAHGRFGSGGALNYEAEALELFDAMRRPREGGEFISMFDAETRLVFDEPRADSAHLLRPACLMPAFYELWARATGDGFWGEAAGRARGFFPRVAHATTGLMPARTYLDGSPVPGWNTYLHESYRAQLHLAVDFAWFASDPFIVTESDRLIRFFNGLGVDNYGSIFSLDGMTLDPLRDPALIAVNGATALASGIPERVAFLQAVWDLEFPTGLNRYYSGLTQLTALLLLGGQFRVY